MQTHMLGYFNIIYNYFRIYQPSCIGEFPLEELYKEFNLDVVDDNYNKCCNGINDNYPTYKDIHRLYKKLVRNLNHIANNKIKEGFKLILVHI